MLQLKTGFSFNQYTKTPNSGKPIIYDNYLQKVKSNNKCLSAYPPIVAEDKTTLLKCFTNIGQRMYSLTESMF